MQSRTRKHPALHDSTMPSTCQLPQGNTEQDSKSSVVSETYRVVSTFCCHASKETERQGSVSSLKGVFGVTLPGGRGGPVFLGACHRFSPRWQPAAALSLILRPEIFECDLIVSSVYIYRPAAGSERRPPLPRIDLVIVCQISKCRKESLPSDAVYCRPVLQARLLGRRSSKHES